MLAVTDHKLRTPRRYNTQLSSSNFPHIFRDRKTDHQLSSTSLHSLSADRRDWRSLPKHDGKDHNTTALGMAHGIAGPGALFGWWEGNPQAIVSGRIVATTHFSCHVAQPIDLCSFVVMDG